MTSNNPQDRRTVSRIDSINFVSYSYYDEDIKVEELGRTLDISLKGIKLQVPKSKVPQDQLELHIALEEVVIKVQGIVAHVKPTENQENYADLGIRFENISRGDEKVLQKFLRDTITMDDEF